MNKDLERLLIFWFESSEPCNMAHTREIWWQKDHAFDQVITDEFADLFADAVCGKLESWKETPLGCVGLVILLDQLPRNMFRDTADAFAYDEHARELTHYALERGFDEQVPIGARIFLYLPLEHSENRDDQSACVALMRDLDHENSLEFAIKHQEIIERFGRFPHRNQALGRPSTPEEIEFLKQPGSSF